MRSLIFFRRSRDEGRRRADAQGVPREWRWSMQGRLAELDMQNGALARHRGAVPRHAWASTLATAMSATSAARIRMDYTIIGAEANLALRACSRLPNRAASSLSYETFALVSDVITSHALAPITMKGISREVIPYAVDSIVGSSGEKGDVVIERHAWLWGFFHLDPSIVKSADTERIRSVLLRALLSLDKRQTKPVT